MAGFREEVIDLRGEGKGKTRRGRVSRTEKNGRGGNRDFGPSRSRQVRSQVEKPGRTRHLLQGGGGAGGQQCWLSAGCVSWPAPPLWGQLPAPTLGDQEKGTSLDRGLHEDPAPPPQALEMPTEHLLCAKPCKGSQAHRRGLPSAHVPKSPPRLGFQFHYSPTFQLEKLRHRSGAPILTTHKWHSWGI